MSPLDVTAFDAFGNMATGFAGLVTIAIGTNPSVGGLGTLRGTLQVAAVSGVATFGDLSIDQIGDGYTLIVSATGPSGAESHFFNITATP
jgi:hypothetical protein